MKLHLDEQMLKELEQLTEAEPMQLMNEIDSIDTSKLNQIQQMHLQYFRARAFVTMNQKSEAEALALDLLSQAVELGDHLFIARGNLVLSKCNNDAGNPERIKRFLDLALEAAKNSLDNRMIVECLIHQAFFYQSQSDRANALKYHAKADHLSAELKESDILLQVKIASGNTYYAFGEYHKALGVLTDAFQLAIDSQDINRQLLIINNLSTLYSVLNRFEDAVAILNRGIAISETHNIALRKVLLLFNLGALYLRHNQHQESLNKLLECMQYSEEIGFNDPKYQYDLYSNLAGCYRYLNLPEHAARYLDKAEALARLMQNDYMVKEIEVNKANLLLSMNKLEEAKKLLTECKKYFRKHDKFSLLIITQVNLADYYELKQNYPKAIATLKEVSPLYTEYMSKVLADKATEFDRELSTLLTSFDEVKTNYSKLASRFTDKILGEFVGQSELHKNVLNTALLASQHPIASVLLTGESGTGKEVLANLIHMNSVRSSGPFIAVNVSAITASLMESEFFGHRKGSFTGAVSDHKGFFQQANNGTLFLDEIGDMPKELQSKLLRVLESRKVTPVGSTAEIPFDCRVISSTNCNLVDMLGNNLFRLDLFHRLNTIEIHIPPLRSRPDDIPLLIEYFAELLSKQNKAKKPTIDSSFFKRMKQYPFPGNVRELRNLLERLFILCPNRKWDESVIAYLPLDTKPKHLNESASVSKPTKIDKELIIKALQDCGGKQKEAAKVLNISESTLTRRIAKLKLEIYTRKGK